MHNVPHGYLKWCSIFPQLTDITETTVSLWQRRYRTKSFTIFRNAMVQKPPSIYKEKWERMLYSLENRMKLPW